MDGWNRRYERGDEDIPSYYYERPELDAISKYYLTAWCDLVTERPVIATMASVSEGVIPRSKIKSYAEDDLGLIGEEVELFISIMRRVEKLSSAKAPSDPEMTDQVAAGDAEGVKAILNRNALPKDQSGRPLNKKPRVRHPRP